MRALRRTEGEIERPPSAHRPAPDASGNAARTAHAVPQNTDGTEAHALGQSLDGAIGRRTDPRRLAADVGGSLARVRGYQVTFPRCVGRASGRVVGEIVAECQVPTQKLAFGRHQVQVHRVPPAREEVTPGDAEFAVVVEASTRQRSDRLPVQRPPRDPAHDVQRRLGQESRNRRASDVVHLQ